MYLLLFYNGFIYFTGDTNALKRMTNPKLHQDEPQHHVSVSTSAYPNERHNCYVTMFSLGYWQGTTL